MRKIDFKFWNKKEKRMQTMDSVSHDYFSLENADLDCIFDNDDLIPLQFTGLYDKKKNPIFEGDRIKVRTTQLLTGKTIYIYGTVTYSISAVSAGYKIDFYKGKIENGSDGFYQCEVIGNIYQKELLETN